MSGGSQPQGGEPSLISAARAGLRAVALAGGYTPRAKRDHFLVKRGTKPGAGEQEVSEDAVILPGDVIRVPERFF